MDHGEVEPAEAESRQSKLQQDTVCIETKLQTLLCTFIYVTF